MAFNPLTDTTLSRLIRDAGTEQVLGVAALTNAELHALRGFCFRVFVPLSLASGVSQYIRFVTGSKSLIILERTLASNYAGTSYELVTGVTGGTAGSSITPFNVLRGSNNTATTTLNLMTGMTTTSEVVADCPLFIGAGPTNGLGNTAAVGGSDSSFDYYGPNSTGYVKVNNFSGTTNIIKLRLLIAEI